MLSIKNALLFYLKKLTLLPRVKERNCGGPQIEIKSGKELRGFKIHAFEPENYVESNGASYKMIALTVV